jgi:hypothetical protein
MKPTVSALYAIVLKMSISYSSGNQLGTPGIKSRGQTSNAIVT